MRTVFFSVIFCVGWAFAAVAQEAEIKGTISSQFDAFKVDDFAQALSFASPALKDFFRTPENFGQMVTQGYPMVWRPADVQFLELREVQGYLTQKVLITDEKGAYHVLDYRMIETPDGWRIAGVQILEQGAASA